MMIVIIILHQTIHAEDHFFVSLLPPFLCFPPSLPLSPHFPPLKLSIFEHQASLPLPIGWWCKFFFHSFIHAQIQGSWRKMIHHHYLLPLHTFLHVRVCAALLLICCMNEAFPVSIQLFFPIESAPQTHPLNWIIISIFLVSPEGCPAHLEWGTNQRFSMERQTHDCKRYDRRYSFWPSIFLSCFFPPSLEWIFDEN